MVQETFSAGDFFLSSLPFSVRFPGLSSPWPTCLLWEVSQRRGEKEGEKGYSLWALSPDIWVISVLKGEPEDQGSQASVPASLGPGQVEPSLFLFRVPGLGPAFHSCPVWSPPVEARSAGAG